MGNTNNTSVSEHNMSSNNVSLSGTRPPFFVSWSFVFSEAVLTEVMNRCHVQTGKLGWMGVKIFILLTALPANGGLMWMLLRRRRAMTPSEVLGLNVSVMDVLYCLSLPLAIYTTLHETSETAHSVREALFALNVFGCPLLLALMCLERYVAAAHPVAYIRLNRCLYRLLLCAAAWILTLTVGLLGYFVGLFAMALSLSVIISLLFVVMLLCLLAIVWVLCQSGPGETSGMSVPLKRRALKNILAVMVPSVVAYSPVVALVPYMAVITSHSDAISPAHCNVLTFLLVFPNVGLFIGPMFYLSRLRQVSCCTKDQQSPNSKTQAE